MEKMDPKWKKKWVSVLRTPPEEGGYVQARNTLLREEQYDKEFGWHDEFCCLGVLHNLMVEEGLSEWTPNGDPGDGTWTEMLNLDDDALTRLIYMNDAELRNFLEIARWIQENL